MNKIDALIRNPDREFVDPSELLERSDLSVKEKLLVLRNWHADLIELLKATEESMGSAEPQAGENAAQLARVAAAITQLESPAHQDH